MNEQDKRAHRVARTARQKHPEPPVWTPGSLEHHRFDSHERRRNEETSIEDPGLVALGIIVPPSDEMVEAAMRAFARHTSAGAGDLDEIRQMLTGDVKASRVSSS